jgi:hypothetical protein
MSPPLFLQASSAGGLYDSLLFSNLVMLIYSVTRGSVVLQASGISYPDGIRWGMLFE